MAAHGVYAADGSWRVSVVAGSSIVGRYAANGSINVVESPGTSPVGVNHPCGAMWVTLHNTTLAGLYAQDGSLNVTDNGSNNGAIRVTVVAGTLGGGGGGGDNLMAFDDELNSFYVDLLEDFE